MSKAFALYKTERSGHAVDIRLTCIFQEPQDIPFEASEIVFEPLNVVTCYYLRIRGLKVNTHNSGLRFFEVTTSDTTSFIYVGHRDLN